MALTPDRTRIEHGLTIHEKIIPWGAVWPRTVYDDSGTVRFTKGSKYKADALMPSIVAVTVHNTPGDANAETYTRATWPNANMKDVRVHYYVDDVEVWQNLREDEQGWHAGDGRGKGNTATIAIEICMNGGAIKDDAKAEDNGALLAAIQLVKHGLTLDHLKPHKHWSGKQCPMYILPHWDEFVNKVGKHMQTITGQQPQVSTAPDINAGQIVTIKSGAVYGGLATNRGATIPGGQLAPKQHKVSKLGTNGGQQEALLEGIYSWVGLQYLEPVEDTSTATQPPQVQPEAPAVKTATLVEVATILKQAGYTGITL